MPLLRHANERFWEVDVAHLLHARSLASVVQRDEHVPSELASFALCQVGELVERRDNLAHAI